MRLSIQTLSLHIQKAILRFPAASLLACVWTALCIYRAELEHAIYQYHFLPELLDGIFVCMLGFALMIAITLLGERWKWATMWRIAVAFLCALVLGLYFWLILDLFDGPQYQLIRYVLFFISACLAISVVPFFDRGNEKDFWSFNRRLFQGVAISVIFAGTLCAGVVRRLSVRKDHSR
jgi:hypothetical protein